MFQIWSWVVLYVGELVETVLQSFKRLSVVEKIIGGHTSNYKFNMVIDCRVYYRQFYKTEAFFHRDRG